MKNFKTLTLCHLLVLALISTNCASRRSRHQPTLEASQQPIPPVSNIQNPDAISPPSNLVPAPETPKLGSDAPHITLVLGGAGVASFATVGLLKRFHEEGIIIDSIISTGWPSLFALAYGFLKSVHDVEWFATRLQEKDFYKAGIFDASSGFAGHERLSKLVESTFKQQELNESRVPLILSAANTESDDSDIYDRGEWRTPLLKTMSIPGIFRPYPQGKGTEWVSSLQGLEVDEAKRRGAKLIVAVEMYGDYLTFLHNGKKDSSDSVFRKLYLSALRRSISRELKDVSIVGRVTLGFPPTSFDQKRVAIFSGYKEGARLSKLIRAASQ